VLEGFRLLAATGAGGVGIGGSPGWLGSQITLSGSHLMDSPGDQLAQAHQGPWGQGRKVEVVPWGREQAGPLREECLPYPLLQGGIGGVHQGLGRECEGRADKVTIDHGHPR